MKPYNSNVIKVMAAHSDECAAYASAMKWDWLRRQKIEDVSKEEIQSNDSCGFCARIESKGDRAKYAVCEQKCQLALAGQHCADSSSYYRQASNAHDKNNQQVFTTAANNLYFQIRSIIDDFYAKPEPKKEVFYHTGQRFKRSGCEYLLSRVDTNTINLIITSGHDLGNRWSEHVKVESPQRITEAEFKKLCGYDTFTLIESKKED